MKSLIISGPPCSGKTYLINELKKNDELLKEKRFESPYRFLNANDIRKNKTLNTKGTLIIHYDCFRSYKRKEKLSLKTDKFLNFIRLLDKPSIAFLSTMNNCLVHRMQERKKRLKSSIGSERMEKLNRLLSLYENQVAFLMEYFKWYNFVENNIDFESLYVIHKNPNYIFNNIYSIEDFKHFFK